MSNIYKPIQVAGIVHDSIVDGPGIRYVLFVQGCPHHCNGCHNPESWPFEGGMERSAEEIFSEIQKNPLVRGVTFSGGEPFSQADALLPLAIMLKEAGYELAIYTGGVFEDILSQGTSEQRELLGNADTLIDGPFLKQKRNLSLKFRGSENQRILNVSASLAEGKAVWEESARWV